MVGNRARMPSNGGSDGRPRPRGRKSAEGLNRVNRSRPQLRGWCKCGCPLLQYHHIVEWAEEAHFRPEDMMVLCPLHHDQATKGAMPELEQRQMKSAPPNIQQGHALALL